MMATVSLVIFLLNALSLLLALGLAVAALGRLIFLGARGEIGEARRFLGAALLAGLPVMITTFCLLWAFLSIDPLWPAQDERPEQQLAYAAARDTADRVYRLLGGANILACLWSVGRLRRAWKRSRSVTGDVRA